MRSSSCSLTGPAYRDRPSQIAYFEEALNRLERIHGVVAAGTVFSPMRGVIQMEGAPPPPPNLVGAQRGIYSSVSSGYFRVMGMRLLQGRWMKDNEPSEVMMVNETFVRRILGGASPLGKSIHIQFPQRPTTAAIVGVVSDVKYSKLDAEPDPEIYFPYRQSFYNGASDVVVRVSGDPSPIAPAVRKTIAGIDPSQVAFAMETLESSLARTIAPRRFNLSCSERLPKALCCLRSSESTARFRMPSRSAPTRSASAWRWAPAREQSPDRKQLPP